MDSDECKSLVYGIGPLYEPTKCHWNPKNDRSTTAHISVDWKKPPLKVLPNVLAAIGHTPMVKLNKIPQQEGLKCDVYVKCEFLNPGGSVKDRMATRIIEDAEKVGQLDPGCTLIESTSGNSGIATALVAAIKGYRVIVVVEDKMSEEKKAVLLSLGAEVIRVSSAEPADSPDGIDGTIQRLLREVPKSVHLNQFTNTSNPLAHYDTTAEEIYDQCDKQIDMIAMGAGSGGTITGIARKFQEISPHTEIVCTDPVGSKFAVPESLNKSDTTFFEVEGIGNDQVPANLNRELVNTWIKVHDKDSFIMARRLIKEEGLLVGCSSGTAMWGAIQAAKAKNLGAGKKVVVILPDGVRNYLTKCVSDQSMEQRHFKLCVNTNNHLWWDKNVLDLELSAVGAILENSSYQQAINVMKKLGVDQIPAVDHNRGVVGVLTMQAILTELVSEKAQLKDPIKKALKRIYSKLEKSSNIGLVARVLEKESYVVIVEVTGEGRSKINRFEAMVTAVDILKYLQKQK